MLTIDDFEQLKRRVDRLQREHDQAVARRDEACRSLQEDYQCATLKEAESLLAERQERLAALGKEYLRKKSAFEKELEEVNPPTESDSRQKN